MRKYLMAGTALLCSAALLPFAAHAQQADTSGAAPTPSGGVAAPSAAAAGESTGGQQTGTQTQAGAEPQAPTQQRAATQQQPSTVGEIVVTAQRRSESLQKVPIAVTAIPPERAEKLGLRNVATLQVVTPGLVVSTGIDYAQIFIRGVGYSNPNLGIESSVATYVDGAYVEHPFGSLFDVLDPSTLQVLRGPQGTLWGRNATGGAILVGTADPTDRLEGRAVGEFGNIGHRLYEGMVNVPINNVLSARFAARYIEDGGYIKDLAAPGYEFGWRHETTLRGKLRFEPNDAFKAVLGIEYDHEKGSGGANSEFLPAVYCLLCSSSKQAYPLNPYTTNVNLINGGLGQENQYQFYDLNMTYNTGPVLIKSTTAYRTTSAFETGDFDFTEIPSFNIDHFEHAHTFSQDLTFSTNLDGRINGTAGVSYLRDSGSIQLGIWDTPTIPTTPSGYSIVFLDNKVTTQYVSGFAEATVELLPHLKLTAGGRYSEDRRRAPGQNVKFNAFTPRGVIAYDTGPFNFYVSYNKGYKAGGFNTPSGIPIPVFQPEKIESYEAGVKFTSPEHRLHANLAIFNYYHKDLQVLIVTQNNINNLGQVQSASARGKGVEVEWDYRPFDFLQTFGGVSYLEANYKHYANAGVQIPTFDAAGNPTGITTGTEDLSGLRVPEAPHWTAHIGATASMPVGSNWKAELTGLARYSSSFDFYPGAGGPLRTDQQPAFFTAQLSGRLMPQDERYEIGFFINNLTNKTYYDFRFTTAPFGGLQYAARPRTFGFRLGYKFK